VVRDEGHWLEWVEDVFGRERRTRIPQSSTYATATRECKLRRWIVCERDAHSDLPVYRLTKLGTAALAAWHDGR
jgi:hypothetical protein